MLHRLSPLVAGLFAFLGAGGSGLWAEQVNPGDEKYNRLPNSLCECQEGAKEALGSDPASCSCSRTEPLSESDQRQARFGFVWGPDVLNAPVLTIDGHRAYRLSWCVRHDDSGSGSDRWQGVLRAFSRPVKRNGVAVPNWNEEGVYKAEGIARGIAEREPGSACCDHIDHWYRGPGVTVRRYNSGNRVDLTTTGGVWKYSYGGGVRFDRSLVVSETTPDGDQTSSSSNGTGPDGQPLASDSTTVPSYAGATASSPGARATTYTFTEQDGGIVRRRETVKVINAQGLSEFSTTILIYHPPSSPFAGEVHRIVEPNQVAKFLADNPSGAFDPANPKASAGIDTADLSTYASSTIESYVVADGVLRPELVDNVGGCVACGQGAAAPATRVRYAYAVNPAFDAGNADPLYQANTWRLAVRSTVVDGANAPIGPRMVQFLNTKHQVVYDLKYEVAGTTVGRVWITHQIFNNRFRTVETRMPSACTGYAVSADAGGWIAAVTPAASGSAGQVMTYQYATSTQGNPDDLVAERVRQGISANPAAEYLTARYTYISQPFVRTHYAGFTESFDIFYLASRSEYPTQTTNLDAGNRITRTWTYDWYPRTDPGVESLDRARFVTASQPVVPTSQNGSGVAARTISHYRIVPADAATNRPTQHYVDWERAPNGRLTFMRYGTDRAASDFSYQRMTLRIEDVKTDASGFIVDPDPTLAAEQAPLGPDGVRWTNTVGAHLVTRYVYDQLGRVLRTQLPNGTTQLMAYARIGSGAQTIADLTLSAVVPTGSPNDYSGMPVRIGVERRDRRLGTSAIGAATSNADGNLLNDVSAAFLAGTATLEAGFVGQLAERREVSRDIAGRMLEERLWSDAENASAHKLTTSYTYDGVGRLDTVTNPSKQIARTIYDGVSRPIATQIGTSLPGLVTVSEAEYDRGVVGDGYITGQFSRFGDGAGDVLPTRMRYDHRGRLLRSLSPDGILTVRTIDWMGRELRADTYVGVSNVDAGLVAASLRTRQTMDHDPRGQVWRSRTHAVDQTNGVVGPHQEQRSWFDTEDRPIKTRDANGLFRKTQYDTRGRRVRTAQCFHDGESGYAAAFTLTGDVVVEEMVYAYDNGDRLVIEQDFRRMPGATRIGSLAESFDAGQARRRIEARWHDAWSREIAIGDYGTGGAGVFSRPALPPAPGSSADVQITTSAFDAFGRQHQRRDNLNRLMVMQFDNLGRRVTMVENWVDGVVAAGDRDRDRTTRWFYDQKGRMATMRAVNATGTALMDQNTRFVHADVRDPDLVTATVYPDSSSTLVAQADGSWAITAGSDHVAVTYDRLGRMTMHVDQRGVQRGFPRNGGGRLVADVVDGLPVGVDGGIRRIGYGYDGLGRVVLVTSFADTAGATPLNQQRIDFGGFGQILRIVQEHGGAITASSPVIAYAYSDGASGGVSPFLRRVSETYPQGRVVHLRYGSAGSVDDRLSRIVAQAADAAGVVTHAAYTYLGASAIVAVAHPQVVGGLTWTLSQTAALDGLDRFDRAVDVGWKRADGTYVDRFQSGYDGVDRRVWRRIQATGAPSNLDEFLTYDQCDRVATSRRGTLIGSFPNYTGVSAPSRSEDWTSDALGNWRTYARNFGAPGFVQSRAANAANEIDVDNSHANAPGNAIAQVSGTGGNWVDPRHDAAGGMTRIPKQGAETTANQALLLVWDAWNRMAHVRRDANGNGTIEAASDPIVASYTYDGLNRRIAKAVFRPGDGQWDRTDRFLNEGWQEIEERRQILATPAAIAAAAYVQYIWDLRYVDALVCRFRDANQDNVFDETLFACNDANLHATAMVDVSGAIVERYAFDPYGRRGVATAAFAPLLASLRDVQHGFTGRSLDDETGLWHFRRREFSDALGRFIGRDPRGYTDGGSLYQAYFVPNASDPSGEKTWVLKTQSATPARDSWSEYTYSGSHWIGRDDSAHTGSYVITPTADGGTALVDNLYWHNFSKFWARSEHKVGATWRRTYKCDAKGNLELVDGEGPKSAPSFKDYIAYAHMQISIEGEGTKKVHITVEVKTGVSANVTIGATAGGEVGIGGHEGAPGGKLTLGTSISFTGEVGKQKGTTKDWFIECICKP